MTSSRASTVLDSLLGRDQLEVPSPRRRNLFRRESSTESITSRSGFVPTRRGMLAVGAVALCLAVVGVVFGWSELKRPVPIEQRMPSAGDARSSTPGSVKRPATDEEPGSSTSGSGDPGQTAPEAERPPEKIVVHVVGAVASPGIVTLDVDSRVVDAVLAAGGLRSDADPERVNLAEHVGDGARVVVPAVGQTSLPEPVAIGGSGVNGGLPEATGGANGKTPGASRVNLNTATAGDLEQLPGVGPATSAAIIAKRDKDGSFQSVDSLLDVRGIGEAKLEAIRDLVTVG